MIESIILPLIGGIVILTLGADKLVSAASRLALAFGVPALIVGLTLVAMGTSAPELAITLISASKGNADIALGNVLGSNVLNILLVLGISSIIRPLVAQRQLLLWDVPIMIAFTGLVWIFASSAQNISATEGFILLALLVPYIILLISLARREKKMSIAELGILDEGARMPRLTGVELFKDISWIILGITGLTVGAHYFTEGAVALATYLSIPEWIVGLTIVAFGTSLPELATSIVAGLKGSSDIAIGNIVGSCIFNLLWVLGPAAFLVDGGLSVGAAALEFDFPFLFIITAGTLPIFISGKKMSRLEGCLFVACYAFYVFVLVNQVMYPEGYDAFVSLLFKVFLPAFAIAILVTAFVPESATKNE